MEVVRAKIQVTLRDGAQDPEEWKVREDGTKRLILAYEAIQKARQERSR